MRTIFTDLLTRGHDEDFLPIPAKIATAAPAGSLEKLDVMRARVENGEDLYHPGDNPRRIPPLTDASRQEIWVRKTYVVTGGNRKSLGDY